MTEPQNTADQPRPDAELNKSNEPGSQSSSGMSNQLDDALVEAHERDKQRRGEPLDVTPEAFGGQAEQAGDSPLGRNPEATTGPVVD
ncbi:hypothetical protein [Hymenobacter sp. CRA2]|uniref:hypothetical protein n=1 Tax=Hymenobacter sp. CRA2 TaxID=1955620 RepID=UPI00098F6AE4|nr:hypothetical protein [Hymenobacter sp. CRA2]OON68586.1 hypothetical protein B0919_13180 [Hymenobacter sp. CRA2]